MATEKNRGGRWEAVLDRMIILLILGGVILMPVQLRYPILFKKIGYYGYVNFPAVMAVLLSFLKCHRWQKAEWICCGAWLLALIPMILSNRETETKRAVTALLMNLAPLFLVLVHMDEREKKGTLRLFLWIFNGFILFLLALGVEEKLNNMALLRTIRDWIDANGYKNIDLTRYVDDSRFASVWAHPLTHTFLFNAFFAVNGIWVKENRSRIPVILIFLAALAGNLLSASKMGIIVCFALLIVFTWKQKKWLLLTVPVFVALYFTGAFDKIIERFMKGDLTTGRLEDLRAYFSSGINPLRVFTGYGTNSVLNKSHPLYVINDAFEAPLMMYAYDYGIVTSLVLVGGVYAYSTCRLLREKRWIPWICYTLLFAEVNTFNAYASRHQEVCFLMCLVTMILLNMKIRKEPNAGKDEPAGAATDGPAAS